MPKVFVGYDNETKFVELHPIGFIIIAIVEMVGREIFVICSLLRLKLFKTRGVIR